MKYKFEGLEVWQLSLQLIDLIYVLSDRLPDEEKYNLKSQSIRAGTSISLNIAERSTTQTNSEQSRFIGYAIRSLIEVIACLRIMGRRKYVTPRQVVEIEKITDILFKKLQAFRNSLK